MSHHNYNPANPYNFSPAFGRTAGRGGAQAFDTETREQIDMLRQAARSPFSDVLPVMKPIRAYFNQITVPAGLSVPAGFSAWYGLRSITFPGDFSQDAMLGGYSATMMAADVNGAGISGQILAAGGAGTALPWGDNTGSSAAIIIGRNLGITQNAWSALRTPDVAGIEMTTVGAPPAQSLVSTGVSSEIPIILRFPPGKWSDTLPLYSELRTMFLPFQFPLLQGSTLDVALVVARNVVDSLAASRVLCGRAEVTLAIGDNSTLNRERRE